MGDRQVYVWMLMCTPHNASSQLKKAGSIVRIIFLVYCLAVSWTHSGWWTFTVSCTIDHITVKSQFVRPRLCVKAGCCHHCGIPGNCHAFIYPLYRTYSNTSSCHLQLNEHSCILNSGFLKPVTGWKHSGGVVALESTSTEEQTFQQKMDKVQNFTQLKLTHTPRVPTVKVFFFFFVFFFLLLTQCNTLFSSFK